MKYQLAGVQGKGRLHGDTGPQGPQGVPGSKGQKGQRGQQGLNGTQGPTGFAGSKGQKGEKGVNGLRGDASTQGQKGERGEAGLTGPQGPEGFTGSRGQKGETGLRGFSGSKGERGVNGLRGPPGPTAGGVVYTRWGRTTCPSTSGTLLLYAGRAAGSHWTVGVEQTTFVYQNNHSTLITLLGHRMDEHICMGLSLRLEVKVMDLFAPFINIILHVQCAMLQLEEQL